MENETTANATPVLLSPEEAEQREAKARKIVHIHSLMTILAGLVPIPFVDLLAMGIIQGRMLKKVGEVYGHSFTGEQRRYTILGVLVGGVALPVLMIPFLGSLIKLIPVVGTAAGIIAMLLASGPVSYALGLTFIQHFESGGTLLSFKPAKLRKVLRDYYEQGQRPVDGGSSKAATQAAV